MSKNKNKKDMVPRGAPKSGRFWKETKTRFRSVIKTRGIVKSNKFERLKNLNEQLKRSREISKAIVAEKQQKIEDKKERRRQNIKRQEENRLKTEVVQVISNPAKIKRMKKKQLRQIEKRDTLNMKKP